MAKFSFFKTIKLIAVIALFTRPGGAFSQETVASSCSAQSGAVKTPVIELYTSEGCSSCPPADKWLSAFKGQAQNTSAPTPVVQAFHVGYWDYIGWVDRFATPAHTTRQRQIAAVNRQSSIYTPQAVLDGRDWRDWQRNEGGRVAPGRDLPEVSISLRQVSTDHYEALVTPLAVSAQAGGEGRGSENRSASWSAYWTLTEDGHSSRVKSGENAGELLKHDFVVRQYTAAGEFPRNAQHPQKLTWHSIAATPGHPRRVNLVVVEPKSGKTLQALSLTCG